VLIGAVEQPAGCDTGAASQAGEPPLIDYYMAAAARYGLGVDGYAFLAAINQVETTFGTDIATSTARAVGWMQFEPATFAKFAVSVTDPAAPADPDDPQDAIYTAANYLHATGAPGDWPAAIYAYNHARWYVSEVAAYALRYSGPAGLQLLANDIAEAWGNQPQTPPATTTPSAVQVSYQTSSSPDMAAGCPAGPVPAVAPVPGSVAVIMPNGLARPPAQAPVPVQRLIAAGDEIVDQPYLWGGGHTQPLTQLAAGYDCSGATSFVLYHAGLYPGPMAQAAAAYVSWGVSGDGQWVTVFANTGHVWLAVAGIVLNTAWYAPVQPRTPDSGPRWQPSSTIPLQLAGDLYGAFARRHPEGF
jgi:hypothetical protein